MSDVRLTFLDRLTLPFSKGYKDFKNKIENTPIEQFYMDGERKFSDLEKKYMKFYKEELNINQIDHKTEWINRYKDVLDYEFSSSSSKISKEQFYEQKYNEYMETGTEPQRQNREEKIENQKSQEEIFEYEKATNERWERKDNYYAFIKEFIIDENKKYGAKSVVDAFNKLDAEVKERYIENGVEDTINTIQDTKKILVGTKSLKEIEHFHSELIKFINELNNQKMEQKFDKEKYLQNQMKYLGFGESEQLHKDLKKGLDSNEMEFVIKTSSEKTTFGKSADFTLNFKKNDNGAVFLNSYDANVVNSKGENLSHRFKVKKEDNITVKEAINLLEGRAVKTNFVNSQTNEKEPAFIKLKLKEEKNDFGNYKLEVYGKNYGVDTAKIVEKSNLIFDKHEYKDFTIKALEKGNLAPVKFKHEDKVIEGKAMLNPQYKTLNLYDKDMNRINTNKPIKGVEIEDNQKAQVKEQSIKRGH